MITFDIELLEEVIDEIQPLLEKHWEEVAVNKEKIFLNPDFEVYQNLEDAGLLSIFTARDEGKLVGYFVVIVNQNPHYKDHLFAANDVIYLAPEYRRTHVGSELIEYAEEMLKLDDVSVLVINTKTHIPFDGVLKRLDFNHTENTYTKYIGE